VSSRELHVLAATVLVAASIACGRSPSAPAESGPSVRLVAPSNGVGGWIEVTGLPAESLERLRHTRHTPEEWSALFRVVVADDAPAMLGAYEVKDGALRFTPAFPLDPGRRYSVRFDPSRLAEAPTLAPVVTTVELPARTSPPSTVVERVYPSGDIVPENLLRVYIEFSAPMSRGSGLEYLELLNESGRPIEQPFLPLDYELWSPDRRRYTVFFDPGRVKDGILPNQQLGRPLHASRTYTLVVRSAWPDAEGLPLRQEFRRVWRVGPASTQPLDPSTWTVTAPEAGGRAPLVVTFGEPLDQALLMRALGVRMAGNTVAGEIRVDPGEQRWTFVPERPWRSGVHELLALSILEDVAGNQIGRAFEVDNVDTVDKSPEAQTVLVPFTVAEKSS
jgi:hypothetical protein